MAQPYTLSKTKLSPREVDIVRLIAEGRTNRDIAAALRISDKTVKGHITRILEFLELKNRTQIAIYAIKEGYA